METTELLKRVRKIEIKSRGLSNQIFAGEYHSAFKGRGMAFSEVREYQYGDDIRNIDWNVTARFNHPYIKIFEEEREMTVMLLVDVSGSRDFGSGEWLKKNIITEICAVLAFSAIQNNDKIGVIMFSDKIEKFISPQKGRQHTLRIIRELIEFKPENKGTNLSEPLRYLTNAIKKRSTAFVISDFFGDNFQDALRIANRKHDVAALKIFDKREAVLPPVGLVQFKDVESGKEVWVDSDNAQVRQSFKRKWNEHMNDLIGIFRKCGVDYCEVPIDEDYVKPLMNLFKKRA